MNALLSLFAVIILVLIPSMGVGALGLHALFGVVIPYLAFLCFVVGFVWHVLEWAKAPVPFRIPTTCGQQKSLPWIKHNAIENPQSTFDTIKRMALEILFFRSLFRNTKMEIKEGPRVTYGSQKYLWAGALAFHWAFLIIVVRHLRFFTEPVPSAITGIEWADSFFQIGVPMLYITDIIIVAALTYLFFRRIVDPKLRYISLLSDYFPLFLLLGIAISGILLRYLPATKTDIVAVKELAVGLVTFRPVAPDTINVVLYIHLFLVSVLLVYFPFSKLMHMPGVFLSPTRNMPNNNRAQRHVNPWNYPVKTHPYEEYENEFREKMKHAGIPVEKE